MRSERVATKYSDPAGYIYVWVFNLTSLIASIHACYVYVEKLCSRNAQHKPSVARDGPGLSCSSLSESSFKIEESIDCSFLAFPSLIPCDSDIVEV